MDYENDKNPLIERKILIHSWKKYAIDDIEENHEILNTAISIQQIGIQKIDSLHLACAIFLRCDYFLTTDDKILLRSGQIKNIKIINPARFINEVFP